MNSIALAFTLEQVPVPLVYATHRIIRDCNQAFASLFGHDRAELIDTSFARLYPAVSDFVLVGELWRKHLAGGATYVDERIMAAADGRRFWCRVNGRSQNLADPFATALYCFQPTHRPVTQTNLSLTGRQRQILTLVALGKTNAQIGVELGLSKRTVEAHRLRLARSAGVANSAELMTWFAAQSEPPIEG